MNNNIKLPKSNIKARLASAIGLFGILFLFTGCLAQKSYVDPTFRNATYLSLKPPANPTPISVQIEFQRNGKRLKKVEPTVRKKVIEVLAVSRMFSEATDSNPGAKLSVILNNVGDMGAAAGKGFGTGLTLGIVGSRVVDGYEMSVSYTSPSGTEINKQYNHAIHSTIGAHSTLENMEPLPLQQAFDQVVEDMLLNFLKDLQTTPENLSTGTNPTSARRLSSTTPATNVASSFRHKTAS